MYAWLRSQQKSLSEISYCHPRIKIQQLCVFAMCGYPAKHHCRARPFQTPHALTVLLCTRLPVRVLDEAFLTTFKPLMS